MNGKFQIKRTWKLTTEYSRREICNPIYSTPEIVAGSNSRRPHRKSPARTHLDLFYRFPARRRPLRDPSSARFSLMASLLLRSAGRVLRRSLQQGPLRRSPAQPFVDNPRRFSSDAVNKHSCAPENSLNSIEAGLDVNLQIMRATAEQAKVILQKITEDELADKKRETVVLGAFAFLGLTLCAGESLFGGVKKEKSQAVEPLI